MACDDCWNADLIVPKNTLISTTVPPRRIKCAKSVTYATTKTTASAEAASATEQNKKSEKTNT